MSKFADRIRILQTATKAETALGWFKENDDVPEASVSLSATVNGYGTTAGQEAQKYIGQAARNMVSLIVIEAKKLAEADVKRGEEVL